MSWCDKHQGGKHCWHRVGATGFSGRYEESFMVECCHCHQTEHQRISDPIARQTIERLENELASYYPDDSAVNRQAETACEPISTLECSMGCGRKFASPEGRDHHEELCEGVHRPTSDRGGVK